ncbi:MAG: hypothetical protein NZ580_08485, partial [Bacteroidia bacterium]|nr:hypothetical protein [Bacteroidia bacterium]
MQWSRWLLGLCLLQAQPIDITQHRIDPRTFVFDDGRTSFMDYVLYQLREHTNCCGTDDIYVEIFFTAEGGVADVRARTGRNECYKQSLRDIILPTRWKVEGFRLERPVYYEFRLNEECEGTSEDNIYKPVSPSGSASPIAKNPPSTPKPTTPPEESKPAPSEPQPIPVTPSLTDIQPEPAEPS